MTLFSPMVLVKAKSHFSHFSGRYGLVNAFEGAKSVPNAVVVDYGLVEIVPLAVMDATHTTGSAISRSSIAHVFGMGDRPQVAPSVVVSHPIDVVNFVFRLFTGNHFPYDSVSNKAALVNSDPNVSAVRFVKNRFSGKPSVPSLAGCFGRVKARLKHIWRSLSPSQNSGIFVIGKQFVQKICGGKDVVFHDGLLSGHSGKRIQVLEHLYPQSVYHGV